MYRKQGCGVRMAVSRLSHQDSVILSLQRPALSSAVVAAIFSLQSGFVHLRSLTSAPPPPLVFLLSPQCGSQRSVAPIKAGFVARVGRRKAQKAWKSDRQAAELNGCRAMMMKAWLGLLCSCDKNPVNVAAPTSTSWQFSHAKTIMNTMNLMKAHGKGTTQVCYLTVERSLTLVRWSCFLRESKKITWKIK